MKDWFDEALKMYKPGEFGYRKISKELNIPLKTVEARFLKYKKQHNVENINDIDIQTAIIKELQQHSERRVSDLCKKYKISERVLLATVEDIKDVGFDVILTDNSVLLNKSPGIKENVFVNNWKGERIIRFALISDTHLCSNAQQLTHLNDFYDICKHEGITDIYHCGDIVDGDCVYPGQMFEVFKFGADAQKDYTVKNYPKRDNVKTHFICGNHCLKWYVKNGYDIGESISREREDLIYLGQYAADVQLTPNCKLRLEHPLGKPAYAISYKTQRKIDNMRGGEKPNILAEGHYHYSDYFFRRNVHAFCVPSFQGPTKFSTRLGLETDNGGWIVEVYVDDEGTITKLSPSYYPYYKIIKNDY